MSIIIALLIPRLFSIYLYFFTTWFLGVFPNYLWMILGFIFMPYTMLWYSAVANWHHGVWGFWQVVFLIIAVLLDLSPSKVKK